MTIRLPKSPMTGAFGESEAGGFWGAELRHAGWDAIVVHGRAATPVYVAIADEQVELHDAAHLWGKETGEVEDTLRQAHGDRLLRVAQTGIAGEHMVRFALIVNDLNEVAGRTCYMSFGKGRKSNEEYLENILSSKHGSVLEHAVWNLLITGVSRALTHELVRHRAGFGYSQLSQRYVDESEARYVVPPLYQENEALRARAEKLLSR